MKYLFTPIRDMFKFSGVAKRKEYFVFILANIAFIILGLTVSTVVLYAMNMDGAGIRTADLPFYQFWFIIVVSLPLIALTVRRLRDQNANPAALIWFAVPFFGYIALFIMGFMPTFVDHVITLPNGETILRSEQIKKRRLMGTLMVAGAVVFGTAAVAGSAQNSTPTLQGGGKAKRPRSHEFSLKMESTITITSWVVIKLTTATESS